MTAKKATIVITGSEFSLGLKQDSNSRMIADLLRPLGINVEQISLVPDKLESIVATLNFLSTQSNYLIVSGGLGPTTDDLTRFAVAELLNVSLKQDPEALSHLEKLFQQRQRPLYDSNKLQALFPEGAEIIFNPTGTAAGFSIATKNQAKIFCLPGVPSELRRMLTESVLPELRSESDANRINLTLRLFGLAESLVGEKVSALNLPKEIEVCFQASFPEIQVIISAAEEAAASQAFQQIKATLGPELIFSESLDISLEQAVHSKMLLSGKTLATAESCTGGTISALLTSLPDCSKYFLGGTVCYSNARKKFELNIPEELLIKSDAVSAEVAQKMATGILNRYNSDFALATTGFAGPSGGTDSDPVGTFYVALANKSEISVKKGFFRGERILFQRYASYFALQLLLQHLGQVK